MVVTVVRCWWIFHAEFGRDTLIAPDADVAQLRKHSCKVCKGRTPSPLVANLRGTVNKVWSLRQEILVTF